MTFEDFYRVEFSRVYRAAWLLSRNEQDALEATQEAFGRAYVRWARLRNEQWAVGWVITTALNIFRKSRRSTHLPQEEDTPVAGPTVDALDLRRALRGLPRRQREALVLYYVGDLNISEVADLMRVKEGTIKAHLSQGRAELRERLAIRHV